MCICDIPDVIAGDGDAANQGCTGSHAGRCSHERYTTGQSAGSCLASRIRTPTTPAAPDAPSLISTPSVPILIIACIVGSLPWRLCPSLMAPHQSSKAMGSADSAATPPLIDLRCRLQLPRLRRSWEIVNYNTISLCDPLRVSKNQPRDEPA